MAGCGLRGGAAGGGGGGAGRGGGVKEAGQRSTVEVTWRYSHADSHNALFVMLGSLAVAESQCWLYCRLLAALTCCGIAPSGYTRNKII